MDENLAVYQIYYLNPAMTRLVSQEYRTETTETDYLIQELMEQVRQEETQVEELSAPVQSRRPASFLEAAGGFLLIIAASSAGAMLLLRVVRKGRASHKGQAYRPKKDMAHIVRRV